MQCFGNKIQKYILHCLCRTKINYLPLNNLTTEETTKIKLSQFVIYIEAIISIRCGSFINFIVVAVFNDCSSSLQHHYRGHAYYNFWENLTPTTQALELYIKTPKPLNTKAATRCVL